MIHNQQIRQNVHPGLSLQNWNLHSEVRNCKDHNLAKGRLEKLWLSFTLHGSSPESERFAFPPSPSPDPSVWHESGKGAVQEGQIGRLESTPMQTPETAGLTSSQRL